MQRDLDYFIRHSASNKDTVESELSSSLRTRRCISSVVEPRRGVWSSSAAAAIPPTRDATKCYRTRLSPQKIKDRSLLTRRPVPASLLIHSPSQMSFDADPLFNEKNAFYKGRFRTVIDDASSKQGAESLVLRASVELDPSKAVKDLKSSKDAVHQAAYALALHKTDRITESLKIADKLMSSTDVDVQLIVATVLARDPDRIDDAIDILSSMENSLEAVALLIQVYLTTHQLAAAQTALQSAKSWAQDAELIQLAEMWVSLRVGGTDNYQSAFYTAQEFADSAGSSARMLLAQAVAEIQLGNYEEAEGTLQQVLQKEPDLPDALANLVVLSTLTGKDSTDAVEKLNKADRSHPLAVEIQSKSDEFDSLASNYTFVEA